jgi:hypothetical protein
VFLKYLLFFESTNFFYSTKRYNLALVIVEHLLSTFVTKDLLTVLKTTKSHIGVFYFLGAIVHSCNNALVAHTFIFFT